MDALTRVQGAGPRALWHCQATAHRPRESGEPAVWPVLQPESNLWCPARAGTAGQTRPPGNCSKNWPWEPPSGPGVSLGFPRCAHGLVEGDSGDPCPAPTPSQPCRHRGQDVYPTGAAGPFRKKGLTFPVSTKALLHAMKTCFGVIDGQGFTLSPTRLAGKAAGQTVI